MNTSKLIARIPTFSDMVKAELEQYQQYVVKKVTTILTLIVGLVMLILFFDAIKQFLAQDGTLLDVLLISIAIFVVTWAFMYLILEVVSKYMINEGHFNTSYIKFYEDRLINVEELTLPKHFILQQLFYPLVSYSKVEQELFYADIHSVEVFHQLVNENMGIFRASYDFEIKLKDTLNKSPFLYEIHLYNQDISPQIERIITHFKDLAIKVQISNSNESRVTKEIKNKDKALFKRAQDNRIYLTNEKIILHFYEGKIHINSTAKPNTEDKKIAHFIAKKPNYMEKEPKIVSFKEIELFYIYHEIAYRDFGINILPEFAISIKTATQKLNYVISIQNKEDIEKMRKCLKQLYELGVTVKENNSLNQTIYLLQPIKANQEEVKDIPQKYLDLIDEIGED